MIEVIVAGIGWSVALAAVAASIWVFFAMPEHSHAQYCRLLSAFSAAVEARRIGFQGLTREVVELAGVVAGKLGVPRLVKKNLVLAAHLRDIGLCAVPYEVLNSKSAAEWTVEEREGFEKHPEVSATVLSLIPSLKPLCEIVRWHHTAYLGGRIGHEPLGSRIPLESRIICCVEAYVETRRMRDESVAVELLQSGRGSRFCPVVLDALMATMIPARPTPRVKGIAAG